jgi:hypothetical protein
MTEQAGPHEHVEVKRHSAGLFDIRNIIGSLVLIYGVVLLIMGLINNSDEDLMKSDGFNINFWAGLGMLLLGVFFIGWSVLRPVVVQSTEVVSDDDTTPGDNAGGPTEG